MDEDDDDEIYGGLYENGDWEWNDTTESLEFKSCFSVASEYTPQAPANIGCLAFRDDLDVIEQQRFRKRFQRKISENDVITLQDVKDVVLYTAPKTILTSSIVNVLHLPMTERFIRALITYCQYYLQVSDEMSKRIIDLRTKIRTTRSEQVETIFRENLEDFRLLVAKEYCSMIMGAGDFAKYHHMGESKKSRSLSRTESILFESLLSFSTQIVYLALGRKSYNKIELEIHRMFKSDIFNIIEHKLGTEIRDSLVPDELYVLLANCLRQGRLINSISPLMSEVICDRSIDYRLLGLGVVDYKHLNSRLRFFQRILIAPEDTFAKSGMSMGILGLPRSNFDTMLMEVSRANTSASTASVKGSASRDRTSNPSRIGGCSRKSMAASGPAPPLYNDIYVPENDYQTEEEECLHYDFPPDELCKKACNEIQRKKWIKQTNRLLIKRQINKTNGKVK